MSRTSAKSKRASAANASAPADNWLATPAGLGLTVMLLAAGPIVPSEGAAEQGSHLAWSLGWLCLLAAPCAVAVLRGVEVRFRWRRADLLLLAGCLLMAATAVWGGYAANARSGWNMAWLWVGAGACLLTLRQTLASAAHRPQTVCVMLGLAAGLAAHGILQFSLTMPALLEEYQGRTETERAGMLREMGIDPAPDSPSRQQFENRLQSTEPYASFALANSLAGVLAPWMVVALAASLLPGASRRVVIISVVLSSVLGGCLLLTKSRAGFLAALLGAAALVVLDLRGQRRLGWKLPALVAAGTMLLVAAAFAAGSLDKEVVTQAVLSLSYRWEYWEATLRMIADRPWLGCGSGSFQDYYGAYRAPHASELVADPHNFVLELAATGGLCAALSMTAGWGRSLWPTALSRDADAPSRDAEASSFGPFAAALFGLAAGLLAALAWGFSPDWLGPVPLALAGGVVGLSTAWWLRREASSIPLAAWDRWLARVARVALAAALVNLLAAGGVSFWGVLQSILVLTVLCGAGASDTHVIRLAAAGRLPAAATALVAPLLLALALQFTSLRPVLSHQQAILQARSAGSLNEARAALEAAAAADPKSPLPHQMMGQARAVRRRWDDTTWSHYQAALQRDQRNASLWLDLADQQLRASGFGDDPALWRDAVESYRQVAALTPRGPAWARLAWAISFAPEGETSRALRDEMAQLAARAIEWDAEHPHPEQRLEHVRLPLVGGNVPALAACRTLIHGHP